MLGGAAGSVPWVLHRQASLWILHAAPLGPPSDSFGITGFPARLRGFVLLLQLPRHTAKGDFSSVTPLLLGLLPSEAVAPLLRCAEKEQKVAKCPQAIGLCDCLPLPHICPLWKAQSRRQTELGARNQGNVWLVQMSRRWGAGGEVTECL